MNSPLFEFVPFAGRLSIESVWARRAPIDIAHGSNWYRDAARTIADRIPTAFEPACAIVAVLSPRLEWSENLLLAETLVTGGARDRGLERNWDKACQILHRSRRGYKWEHLITGPKVSAFYRCLLGRKPEPWVIDTHMVSIHHGYPYRDRISIRQHASIALDYETWYQGLTFHRATALTRSQIQATLWLVWKRRFLPHMKG